MREGLIRPGWRRRFGGLGESSSAEARNGELVSFNTRRIIALVVVLLASTLSGLLTAALTDSRVVTVLGVVAGAVVGIVVVAIWASRSL